MDNKIMEKALEAMRLCFILNGEDTKQELTGNKPTVSVEFFGANSALNLTLFPNGYSSSWTTKEYMSNSLQENVYLDDPEGAELILDKWIEELKDLCAQWGC